MAERFTLPVDDNGNVEFTKEFLAQTGWRPGVKLEWVDNGDGTVTLFEVKPPVYNIEDYDDVNPG